MPDPARLTNEQGEKCQACGAIYATVYLLPDDVWAKITPSEHAVGGLLCLPCADERARAAGFVPFWSAGHLAYPSAELRKAQRLSAAKPFETERELALICDELKARLAAAENVVKTARRLSIDSEGAVAVEGLSDALAAYDAHTENHA